MKLAIVHISDIHFRTRNDVCLRRVDKFANAIKYARDPEEKLLFVVTGDIANTGSPEEYEIAENFFRPLFIDLGINHAGDLSEVIFIPGNHDCNFKGIGDLRPQLLDDIQTKLENMDATGETAQSLLQVQAEFFKFQEDLTGCAVAPDAKLYFRRKFEIGEYTIEFRCFNSAWLSSKHEDPGTLGFPQSTIRAASAPTDSDVVISMVHHPSNWLGIATHNLFRTSVQQNSDFMFTGHEHTTGGQIIAAFDGTKLIHFESGPFQPTDSGESEFGILHIDLAKRKWKHDNFRWRN